MSFGKLRSLWMSAPTSALAKDLRAAGKASKYTRSRLPVKLAYSEPKRSKSAALKRESLIKKLRRAEKELLVAKQIMAG